MAGLLGVEEHGPAPFYANVSIITGVLAVACRSPNAPTAPAVYRTGLLGLGGPGLDCVWDQSIDIVLDATATVRRIPWDQVLEFYAVPGATS